MSRSVLAAIALLLAVVAPPAASETGTLERIKDSGRFVIGFTPDAPPVSFIDEAGAPAGYSVELCRRIATAVRRHLGLDEMTVAYVPLDSPKARIDAVVDGTVDIECGASTITLSRRKQVDFTLMTLITGASVLAKKASGITSNADLSGKKIAVIEGTTTEEALNLFLKTNEFGAEIKKISNHIQGMEALEADEVDAYASDYVMLLGQTLQAEEPEEYVLPKDLFSFEPYAFMVRRNDAEFRLVADTALAKLYGTAAIRRLYFDWFGRVAPSRELQAMYQFQALPE